MWRQICDEFDEEGFDGGGGGRWITLEMGKSSGMSSHPMIIFLMVINSIMSPSGPGVSLESGAMDSCDSSWSLWSLVSLVSHLSLV